MGRGDLSLRNLAVPFRALWFDDTATYGNEFVPGSTTTGDLYDVMGTLNPSGGQIRLTRPFYGDIISAVLTMQATAPVSSPTILRFYKGDFDADGITAVTSYTEARRASDWQTISGYSSELVYGSQANIFIDGLDITSIIPKRGDADFNEDGFILGVDLTTKDTDWYLYNFKVDCTVQLGALYG